MQPTASSANPDRCKENPYHQTGNNCVRTGQCPYHGKPAQMHAGDFRPGESVSLEDNFCYICRSRVADCPTDPPPPPPPPPPPEPDGPRPPWIWLVIGAGVLLLLGGIVWRLFDGHDSKEKQPPPNVCRDGTVKGDTCMNYIKYQVLCDSTNGYRLGKRIGDCGTPPCTEGKVVDTICQGKNKFQKVCDGKGGFKIGKRIGRCGPPPTTEKDGLVTKRDPLDGKCKEFIYKGGRIIGATILPDDQCN